MTTCISICIKQTITAQIQKENNAALMWLYTDFNPVAGRIRLRDSLRGRLAVLTNLCCYKTGHNLQGMQVRH